MSQVALLHAVQAIAVVDIVIDLAVAISAEVQPLAVVEVAALVQAPVELPAARQNRIRIDPR